MRITPHEKSASRENMFRMQQKMAELGVPMCRPVAFGACDEGVYNLQTWIDGQDAEEVIPNASTEEQYTYGWQAGSILQTIHLIPSPDTQPEWEPRFLAKAQRNIKIYQDCPVRMDGAQKFIACIEQNRHLLKNRPQCFQHGDYHIGNFKLRLFYLLADCHKSHK